MAASRRLALLATLVLGTLCACSPGGATATTTSETTSTAIATTTSSTPDTATTTTPAQSTTIPAEETVQVLLQPFSEMGGAWSELFLTYGEAEDQIGTAPGGDGVMLGPEYGTQTPDGNWWILDAAKQRAAVYTEDGSYQDQVPFPEEVLVDGRYFQYQMPQALDDGSIAATGFRGEDSTSLLRIIDGKVTSITFEGSIPWVTTDGTYLYGLGEDAAPYRLDVANPPGRRVANLVTRCGTHYRIAVQGDEIVIDNFPYPGMRRTLQLRYSEDPDVIAHGGIEVETGFDGSLFILMYGAPESDEGLGIGGFLMISPEGVVSDVEPIRDPSSPADPGSPARLGVTPGTSNPWLMMVDEDGVRIYTRG